MARPRQITDAQVLEVARRIFTEQGPQASTELIARELGVSSAAIFKRFGSKDDLLMAALLPHGDPGWIELAERGPGPGPLKEQLFTLAELISDFLERLVPALWTLKAAGHKLETGGHEGANHSPARGIEGLATWFTLAQEQGRVQIYDPVVTATAFVGAMHTRVFFHHMAVTRSSSHFPPQFDLDRAGYLHELVELLWGGLAPREES